METSGYTRRRPGTHLASRDARELAEIICTPNRVHKTLSAQPAYTDAWRRAAFCVSMPPAKQPTEATARRSARARKPAASKEAEAADPVPAPAPPVVPEGSSRSNASGKRGKRSDDDGDLPNNQVRKKGPEHAALPPQPVASGDLDERVDADNEGGSARDSAPLQGQPGHAGPTDVPLAALLASSGVDGAEQEATDPMDSEGADEGVAAAAAISDTEGVQGDTGEDEPAEEEEARGGSEVEEQDSEDAELGEHLQEVEPVGGAVDAEPVSEIVLEHPDEEEYIEDVEGGGEAEQKRRDEEAKAKHRDVIKTLKKAYPLVASFLARLDEIGFATDGLVEDGEDQEQLDVEVSSCTRPAHSCTCPLLCVYTSHFVYTQVSKCVHMCLAVYTQVLCCGYTKFS